MSGQRQQGMAAPGEAGTRSARQDVVDTAQSYAEASENVATAINPLTQLTIDRLIVKYRSGMTAYV